MELRFYLFVLMTTKLVTSDETTLPPPALSLSSSSSTSPTNLSQPPVLELSQTRFDFACQKSVEHCTVVPNATCLDSPLPYSKISFELTGRNRVFWEVQQELNEWRPLKNVPKCWSLIQQLLCSVYLPECHDNQGSNKSIALVSQQLCRAVQGPCRIVKDLLPDGWPQFLQCQNDQVFSPHCDSRIRSPIKLNTTQGLCKDPLVATEKATSFHPLIDECGMKCRDPLFDQDTYRSVRNGVGLINTVQAIMALFVLATYALMDWRNEKLYPGVIIFFMTSCWLLISCGFLLQFLASDPDHVVCDSDGTRKAHVAVGEGHQLCTLSFCLVYFPMTAAMLWFCMLCYCWNLEACNAEGKFSKTVASRVPLFHLLAWFIPFFMTLIVIALNLIEADSLYGVCFVTKEPFIIRFIFVSMPIILTVMASLFFNCGTFKRLRNLANWTTAEGQKISVILLKRSAFCIIIYFCLLSFVCYELYTWTRSEEWTAALNDLVLCNAGQSDAIEDFNPRCELKLKPNSRWASLNLLLLFGLSLSVFAWIASSRTLVIWRGALRRMTKCQQRKRSETLNASRHLGKKHEILQQVYARRGKLDEDGRLSISLPSVSAQVLGGPVGMNVMQDTSVELSSSFVAAIPRLVTRRNAIWSIEGGGASSKRPGKDLNSFDSQMSIQPNELEHLRTLYDTRDSARTIRGMKKKFKSKSRRSKLSRRLSISSVTSNGSTGSRIVPAVTVEKGYLSDSACSAISSSLAGFSSGIEMTDFRKIDMLSHSDLKERLRQLNTSAEEDNNDEMNLTASNLPGLNVGRPDSVDGLSKLHASVQTSMTDLSMGDALSPKPSKELNTTQSVGTQYDESHLLEPRLSFSGPRPMEHIEPHVIRLNVASDDSDKTSSSNGRAIFVDNHFMPIGPRLLEIHNRARRNGLIPDQHSEASLLAKGNSSSQTSDSTNSKIGEESKFTPAKNHPLTASSTS